MKIFLSFLQGPENYPIPAYSFWQYYIKNGIEESGDQWDECPDADWAKGLTAMSKMELDEWKAKTWEKTVYHIKKTQPDLFLSYLYPHQIDRNAIDLIKRSGVICVNFFCDNYREFERIPNEFGSFDLNWVPEFGSLAAYKSAGFKHLHLPMPMWVDPIYRNTSDTESQQVTFIGSADQQRVALFNETAAKINTLKIYGKGWIAEEGQVVPQSSVITKGINQLRFIKTHGMKAFYQKLIHHNSNIYINEHLAFKVNKNLSFKEYIHHTRDSIITLGVNRFPSFRFPFERPGKYSRLRDIEAPMLGACYLTEWSEGLDLLYDTDEEIASYSSSDELIYQIERLSKDKPFRDRLRKKGQQRALFEHSVPNTLKLIKASL